MGELMPQQLQTGRGVQIQLAGGKGHLVARGGSLRPALGHQRALMQTDAGEVRPQGFFHFSLYRLGHGLTGAQGGQKIPVSGTAPLPGRVLRRGGTAVGWTGLLREK